MVVNRKIIEDFIRRAYDTACSHGFHDVKRSDEYYLMLVLSEIGEMVEADRKNSRANRDGFEKCVGLTWNDRFRGYIKDTLEDELADIAIRIFDFCGTKGVNPMMTSKGVVDMSEEFVALFGKMSVCEQCFALSCLVTGVSRGDDDVSTCMGYIIAFLFEFAAFHGIDLEWHIEQKMRYNETRPKKHGKNY